MWVHIWTKVGSSVRTGKGIVVSIAGADSGVRDAEYTVDVQSGESGI